ncbi:hypothetical protein TNCV_1755951 [Trichonephila clavipes]|nr:hypothetical protein TNCV_1755951 [Trichonephila clavipes]
MIKFMFSAAAVKFSNFDPSMAIKRLKSTVVEESIHVKSIEAYPPIGLVWKLGEGEPVKISSLSLDSGSKLRGTFPTLCCFKAWNKLQSKQIEIEFSSKSPLCRGADSRIERR